MASPFPSYPPCCQKVLVELERENRNGARNCEKGHSVSVDRARVVEAEALKKAAAASKPAA